jgi:hypothetical protein
MTYHISYPPVNHLLGQSYTIDKIIVFVNCVALTLLFCYCMQLG